MCYYICEKWKWSYSVLFDSLRPMDYSLPGSSIHGIFQTKYWNGCHFLLQGLFLTERLNPGLPYCGWILYQLSHKKALMHIYIYRYISIFFPWWWLSGKEPTCHWGDTVLTPGSGRSPGEGNRNSLQYSCLGNMDRGAWQVTIHGVTGESETTQQVNNNNKQYVDMAKILVKHFYN